METASLRSAHHPAISLNDRAEIIDALYRFGAGQDLRDRALFESAFSSNATLDFTQPAQRLGVTIPVFEGRQAIAENIFSAIGNRSEEHTSELQSLMRISYAVFFL